MIRMKSLPNNSVSYSFKTINLETKDFSAVMILRKYIPVFRLKYKLLQSSVCLNVTETARPLMSKHFTS